MNLNEILAAEAKRLGYKQPPAQNDTPRTLTVVNSDSSRASAWAARKLEGVCADLAAMGQDSGRNAALNAAAYSLGRLSPKWLDEDTIHGHLLAASQRNGLVAEDGQRACEKTIVSGLDSGQLDPRDPPVDEETDLNSSIRDWLDKAGVANDTGPEVDPATGEVIPDPLPRLDLNLLTEPCPDPDWLVEGRMTRQSLTLLGAKPGIGKSWTALDLAIALTSGRDWIGHPIGGLFRVLYIDVENGEVLARRRLQQLGADADAIGGRLYYVTEAVMFPGGKDSRRYADTLAAFKPDLVIVDTLASAAPSAERDTEAMSLFLSDIWHRARDSGSACLILAHLRKSQQGAGKDDPLDSFRGAGHLVGAASRAWLLDPRGPEKFVLRDVKTREFPACRPTRIELVDEDLPAGSLTAKRTTVTVDGYEDEDLAPEVAFQHQALELIENQPLKTASTGDLMHIATAAGLATKTASNLLTQWVKDGVLVRIRKGTYSRPVSAILEAS